MAKNVRLLIAWSVTGAECLKGSCFGYQAVTRQGQLDKGRTVG